MAFTRDCFTSKLYRESLSSFYCPDPPATPTLLQYYRTIIAQYTPPPPTPPSYAIHYTLLVMAILCKGQGEGWLVNRRTAQPRDEAGDLCTERRVGLYTILPSPILYDVWDTNGRSEGGSYTAQSSCNSIASGWTMQVGAGNERMVDSCTKASK